MKVSLGQGEMPNPGLRFTWLPAGRFLIGSPTNEVDRYDDEGPQTQVTLTRGFYMGRYPVTQGEYLSVIGSNPSAHTGDTNLPVEQVSWNDATNYCAQLTAQQLSAGQLSAGWVYRLPTEAEWEYACRAGSTNRFCYGDDPGYTQLANYVWYDANSGGTTHPVGGLLPNVWGLYDMGGNVSEWCSSYYGAYPGGSVTDPQDWIPGPLGLRRVSRCGDYGTDPTESRSACRNSTFPDFRFAWWGFRVVLAPVLP